MFSLLQIMHIHTGTFDRTLVTAECSFGTNYYIIIIRNNLLHGLLIA